MDVRGSLLSIRFAAMWLVLPSLACRDQGSPTNGGATSAEARFGYLQVALTDKPIDGHDVTAINVCIERVDIVFADNQPHGTIAVSRTINLLDLTNGVTTSLGIAQFPVGMIQQVRLILCPDGAMAVVDGVEVPVKIPSGEQTGLKLMFPGGFEIRENVTTTIILDFDAERSLHLAPGQGWMLTPVVQLVEAAIVLAITEPAPGAFVPLTLTARGTVASKEPLESLTVNGVEAVVNGLGWSTEITLLEGPGNIHVEAIDARGRMAVLDVSCIVDGTAPEITWLSPPAVVAADNVLIRFSVDDSGSGVTTSSIRLTIDAADVTSELQCQPSRPGGVPQTECSVNHIVGPGPHTLTARAADLVGNSTVTTRTTCISTTCAARGVVCGTFDDLCGGEIACGDCDVVREPAIARLRAANGDGADFEFEYLTHADGGVRYLGGGNIAPGCPVPLVMTIPEAAAAVQCFLDDTAPLHVTAGEFLDNAMVTIVEVDNADDGHVFISARQYIGEFPVRNGEAKLVAIEGHIIQYVGHLYPPGMIPSESGLYFVSDIEAAQTELQTDLGLELQLLTREFIPERQAGAALFRMSDDHVFGVLLDERRHEIVAWVPLADDSRMVERAITVDAFPAGFERTGLLTDMSILVMQEEADSYCIGSPCMALADYDSDNRNGEPRVRFEDTVARTCDVCEVHPANDGVTFGCPRLLGYCPDTPWAVSAHRAETAYFWLHDLAQFARSSRAAYNDWYSWTNAENLDVRIVRTGDTSCPRSCTQRVALGHAIEMYLSVDDPIDNTPETGEYDGPRQLYTLAHEYGHVVHDFYDANWTYGYALASAKHEGFADHNLLRYVLYRWLENRPWDQFQDPVTYDASFGRFNQRHAEGLQKGLHSPRAVGTRGENAALVFDSQSAVCSEPVADVCVPDCREDGNVCPAGSPRCDSSTGICRRQISNCAEPCPLGQACDEETGFCMEEPDCRSGCPAGQVCFRPGWEKHDCGSVLVAIYWELAWNQMRVGYRDYPAETQIITSGPHAPAAGMPAETPANVAFTFAIKSQTGGSGLEEFAAAVHRRYRRFRDYGAISPEDYDRVGAVLNHHCLGMSHHCTQRILPGTRLPVRHSNVKAQFAPRDLKCIAERMNDSSKVCEDEILIPAHSIQFLGGQAHHRFWRNANVNRDWHDDTAQVVRFEEAGDYFWAGTVVRFPYGTYGDPLVRVQVDVLTGLPKNTQHTLRLSYRSNWVQPGGNAYDREWVISNGPAVGYSAYGWSGPGEFFVSPDSAVLEIWTQSDPADNCSDFDTYADCLEHDGDFIDIEAVHIVACVPLLCEDIPGACGYLDNGCGSAIWCGSGEPGVGNGCVGEQSECLPDLLHPVDLGGVMVVAPRCQCVPRLCSQLGVGTYPDGCNGFVTCGVGGEEFDWADNYDSSNPHEPHRPSLFRSRCDVLAGRVDIEDGGTVSYTPYCRFPPCDPVSIEPGGRVAFHLQFAADPMPSAGGSRPTKIVWYIEDQDPTTGHQDPGCNEDRDPYGTDWRLELEIDPTTGEGRLTRAVWPLLDDAAYSGGCANHYPEDRPVCAFGDIGSGTPKLIDGNNFEFNLDPASNILELIVDEDILVRYDELPNGVWWWRGLPGEPFTYWVAVECSNGNIDYVPNALQNASSALWEYGAIPSRAVLRGVVNELNPMWGADNLCY